MSANNNNPIIFKGLKEEPNCIILPGRNSRESIYVLAFKLNFETKDKQHKDFFTRIQEFPGNIIKGPYDEDEANKRKFVIKDNPETGLISFGIHEYKTAERTGEYKWWSSRAGVVNQIPGFNKCICILVDNCVYHMSVDKALEFVPKEYSLVQVHDKYAGPEIEFSIVTTEDANAYPEYLVEVKREEIKGWED